MRWKWKRFVDAARGVRIALGQETHLKIQVVIAIAVCMLGIITHISALQWIIITGCIAAVLSLELVNTAIEKLCNVVHPDYHPLIGQVKDIAAGAVLVVALASAIIGCLVFIPAIQSSLAT
jgi:diacylglycerol kinase